MPLYRWLTLGALCMGMLPFQVFAVSDDEVFEQTIVRLEQIQITNNLALGFEQWLFRGWYGRDVNFGLGPENWNAQKQSALSASSIDKTRKYTDQELQRFLTEYERLKAKYAPELERYPSTQKESIRKNLSWWYTQDKSAAFAALLEDPLKKKGWEKNIRYQAQSTRLLGLARVVLQIAPDRFLATDVTTTKLPKPLDPQSLGSYDMLSNQHEAMDYLIHSEVLNGILPKDFDLNALRKLDVELHDQWTAVQDYRLSAGLSSLGQAIFTLDQGLIWNAATASNAALQADAKEKIPRQLMQLSARLKTSADKTAVCKSIRSRYSEASLKLKWSDWQRVQLADGGLAMQDPDAMGELVNGYSWGCFTTQRDSVTARRLLEAWANQHGDQGRLTAATHCKLAYWYGQGIGGSKDPKKSAEWRERAKTQAEVTCNDGDYLPIDPSDPWREL